MNEVWACLTAISSARHFPRGCIDFCWVLRGRILIRPNIRIIRHEPFEVSILRDSCHCIIDHNVVVGPIDHIILTECFNNLRFKPTIPLCTGGGIILNISFFISSFTNQLTTSASRLNWAEVSDLSDKLIRMLSFRKTLIHIEIQSGLNFLSFTEVIKFQRFLAKQILEYIWNSKLSSCCSPPDFLTSRLVNFRIFEFCNVNCIVYKTKLLELSLSFK